MNSRSAARRCLLALLWLLAPALGADEPFDFKSHFFLKHLVGEWITEGDLKGADGNIVKLKEEWKASLLGDDTFMIEGTRELNGNSEHYKWTITRSPTTGLFEAAHRGSDNNPDTQRFEINFSEAEMKMEWTGFLGSGNSKAIIVDTFQGADRDSFKSEVTLSDDSGATTLSGPLKSTRVKKE